MKASAAVQAPEENLCHTWTLLGSQLWRYWLTCAVDNTLMGPELSTAYKGEVAQIGYCE